MRELTYVADVVNGHLKIVNRKGFDEDMVGYEGKRLLLKVKRYNKSRSNKQNAYYHGCIIPYVQDGLHELGFEKRLLSAENVHHMLRDMFLKEDLPVEDGQHAGEFITMVKSTADLSTTEFMDYIADIQKWAAEFLSVIIPDPGEQSKIDY